MRSSGVLLLGLLYLGMPLWAQDADTIQLKNDNRKFTIVSQIQDPVEAAAFLSIVSAAEPAARYKLAHEFLQKYPQSWVLAQVYDRAARSAFDLTKYDEAIADGRFSLRLLPENPSLLILLANVEAQKGQLKRAIDDASDALEYVNQIERPPDMSQPEWDAIQSQLRSSAYFARARAEVSGAMAEHTAPALQDAFRDLNRAAAWNSDDPEVFYLRAMVEVQIDQKSAAASDLASVLQGSALLRDKAKTILSILSRQLAAPGTPLEAFLTTLPVRIIDPNLRREDRQQDDPQALLHGYAGPEACRGCHTKEYVNWRQTGMARMLQAYRKENVIGDFSPATQYSENSDVIRLGTEGRPYFEFPGSGKLNRYYVDFTIGSKWQQAYATKLPDGRLQVLPIEYNLLQKKWINYWKMIDPPGGSRANIQDFTKLTAATNYQQNCAICHTSQLKADLAAANSMEHATYLQPGIDCEMCHGPSAWHIKQMNASTSQPTNPAQSPVDFRKVGNRDGVRVCAQCHRQSAVREIGAGGEMNYSAQGSFIPTTWLLPYDAFSRKAFYKDGRFHETTFIVEAFTRSACYLRGTAQCASCHSPHLDNFESNPTSLKSQPNPNELCLGCHLQFRSRIAQHSRHLPNSEASQCVTCHMPRLMDALLFKARSHQIEIPSADLTQRFGQQESPNVCLTCHAEKSAAWAQEQLAAWKH